MTNKRNLDKKSKFLPKIEIFTKNRNFYKKNRQFEQKSKFLSKNQNFYKKSNLTKNGQFEQKSKILSKKSNIWPKIKNLIFYSQMSRQSSENLWIFSRLSFFFVIYFFNFNFITDFFSFLTSNLAFFLISFFRRYLA